MKTKGSKKRAPRKPRPGFNFRVAGITVDPPGSSYGPRIEDHFEFIWIMDSEATVRFGVQKIQAVAGTILLRPPGMQDHFAWSARRSTAHAYIHFDLDPRRAAEFSRIEVPASRAMPPNDILRPLFGYIVSLNNLAQPLRSQLVLPALDLMLRAYASGKLEITAEIPRPVPEMVEKAVEMIRSFTEQEPSGSPRLGVLAGAANTTPENLCRVFKQALNLSPLEYAKLVRLNKAAIQIRTTTRGLKAVAASTGFYDAYHLSRSFAKIYGVSPKAFRESELSAWLSMKNPITRTLFQRDPVKPA